MKYSIELLNKMANAQEDSLAVQYLKKGGIHIKEKNRGKFTESAKRAGKSVQEHARNVVNDPNATTLQKRRAQFALNAKKFKHAEGDTMQKPTFEEGVAMIPPDKIDLSPNSTYDYRVAYKYAPGDQLEAYATSDGHLFSAYQDPESGIYYFAKRKDHPTIDLELDFYYGNSPESKAFRKDYILDTSGDYYRYIPVRSKPTVPFKQRNLNNLQRPK